jgi:CheY-like chemotaxis protein
MALELLAGATRFDAVLMDLQMPEMDGYATCAAIRANPALAELPIIAMTAHAMAEERARCLAAGMNDHIAKPVDPDMMVAVLARWTGRTVAATAGTPEQAQDGGWLDETAALKRLGGNQALYLDLLEQFAEQSGGAPERIEAALAQGERASAAHEVHTIRGVAANLGALSLAQAAGRLEQALKGAAGEAAALEAFTDTCRATMAAIAAVVPVHSAPCDAAEPAAPAALVALAQLLAEADPAALESFRAERNAFATALGATTEPFERALRNFDFELAHALLCETLRQQQ